MLPLITGRHSMRSGNRWVDLEYLPFSVSRLLLTLMVKSKNCDIWAPKSSNFERRKSRNSWASCWRRLWNGVPIHSFLISSGRIVFSEVDAVWYSSMKLRMGWSSSEVVDRSESMKSWQSMSTWRVEFR